MPPEADANRRADEPAGPDVADVLEAVEADVGAEDDVEAGALVEQGQRPAKARRQDVAKPAGPGRELRLALGDDLLGARELRRRVPGALGVDQDALVAADIAGERAQRRDLARRVVRRAPHVVGGHPAAADIDGGKRLELALEDEAQPHARARLPTTASGSMLSMMLAWRIMISTGPGPA